MRTKLMIPSLVVAALGISACGSSSSSSSSTSSASKSTTAPATTKPAKKGKPAKKATTNATILSRTYSVKMTGAAETPAGAPKGTAAAVITIHGETLKVCWRFSHLAGFTGPTFSHIHVGPKGTSGNIVVPLSTGAKFLSKGCVPASAAVIEAIEKKPHGYYVNIHSKKYPGGAVRAQL